MRWREKYWSEKQLSSSEMAFPSSPATEVRRDAEREEKTRRVEWRLGFFSCTLGAYSAATKTRSAIKEQSITPRIASLTMSGTIYC